MAKVVTFGELMLKLAPNGYYRFFQNDQMQATFGGGGLIYGDERLSATFHYFSRAKQCR